MSADPSMEDPSVTVAANGFVSAGWFSGLLTRVQEHFADIEISVEHVINYGGPGRKVRHSNEG